jgi:hypothetical protein
LVLDFRELLALNLKYAVKMNRWVDLQTPKWKELCWTGTTGARPLIAYNSPFELQCPRFYIPNFCASSINPSHFFFDGFPGDWRLESRTPQNIIFQIDLSEWPNAFPIQNENEDDPEVLISCYNVYDDPLAYLKPDHEDPENGFLDDEESGVQNSPGNLFLK